MLFRLLGPLEVEVEGGTVDLGPPLQRALLTLLLFESGHVVSTDTILDVMWGDDPPATARKSVQKYVSQLRKLLPGVITSRSGGYLLEPVETDVEHFEETVQAARSTAAYETAFAWWRGTPYQELVDWPGSQPERTRLEEVRMLALENKFKLQLSGGDAEGVIGALEEMVARHPLREGLWGLLMRALYRANRQADALRAYQRLRRQLAEELGIEPSLDLQQLENQILLQDPSLRSGEAAGSNLPSSLTSFVGRTEELDRMRDVLGAARLVTLVGPGGSGKSRLALEHARQSTSAHPGGVWWSELAPVTSPDRVATALAAPLGVGSSGERLIEDLLIDYLRERNILLVVDNCEHLVGEVARLLDKLLRSSDELTVLATSREPLGIPGEVVFEVLPLSLPEPIADVESIAASDAVRLLLDRVREVDQQFMFGASNATAIASICRTLDGMPLALELVAAQFRSFTPNEIVTLLGRRFELLVKGQTSAPARHRTLRAAVAWSYELLDEPAQRLFRRLAVFRGGFDLEAATEVCSWDVAGGIAASLSSLVDKSLVIADRREGGTRYRLLETLRQFGREVAPPEEVQIIRTRHAGYYCRLAEKSVMPLRGPHQGTWLRRLATEHDNLLKGMRWAFGQDPEMGVRMAVALWSYWDPYGPRSEGQHWLERAVTISENLPRSLYTEALLAASDAFVSSRINLSIDLAERALAHLENDGLGKGRAMRALGWAMGLAERPGEAQAVLAGAVPLLADDPWEQALAWERMGQVDFRDPTESLARFDRSLHLYLEVKDLRRAAIVKYKKAEVAARAHRDLGAASDWAAEALAVLEALGSAHDIAHCHLEVSRVARLKGDRSAAKKAAEASLDGLRRIGDERCTGRALALLAIVQVETGELEAAIDAASEAVRVGNAVNEKQTVRLALAALAGVAMEKGKLEDAATLYAAADRLQHAADLTTGDVPSIGRSQKLADLKASMSDSEFAEAWQTGGRMPLEEAIERALNL